MIKAGVDQDALIQMFSQATAKQGEALRKSVAEATLKALQSRELTVENIKKVLKSVTHAASAGTAQNSAAPADAQNLLAKAFAGMDAALLQAVQAHRKALQQFVAQGSDLHEKQLKGALANIENLEDTFFAAVTKAVAAVAGPLQDPWAQVLQTMKIKGTDTGVQATQAVEQLLAQTQQALRDGRSTSAKTAQTLLDGYAALVSGVLIGMSEGLQAVSPPAAGARKK